MEDQNQQKANPQPSQPLTEPSGTSYISSTQSKKVLQPSETLVQEVKAEQEARVRSSGPIPAPQLQPQTSTTPAQSTSVAPSEPAAAPQSTRPNPSTIYPDATKDVNANATHPSIGTSDDSKNTVNALAFDAWPIRSAELFSYINLLRELRLGCYLLTSFRHFLIHQRSQDLSTLSST